MGIYAFWLAVLSYCVYGVATDGFVHLPRTDGSSQGPQGWAALAVCFAAILLLAESVFRFEPLIGLTHSARKVLSVSSVLLAVALVVVAVLVGPQALS